MRNTTQVYIVQDDKVLMLFRNKKKVDMNKGKWIGVGGKFEEGESPWDCMVRETFEETGLRVKHAVYRGLVTFVSDEWGTEYMHIYTVDEVEGELRECREGELHWIPKDEILQLNLWEGDRAFLPLLFEGTEMFHMKLVYHGDDLTNIIKYD